MPKSEEIISTLHSLSNNYSFVAILWHAIVIVFAIMLMTKWNPSNRLMGVLISLPLFSVAVFAWIAGNPFNGTLFSIMGLLTIIFGLRGSLEYVSISSPPFFIIGVLMIIFGFVYPHFLNTDTFMKYLYSSPLGLVPCPTLSLLIGIILIFNGSGSNAISITFIIFGLFYGLFGVFKLGVHLDIGLLLGTLTLIVKYVLTIKSPAG